MKKIIVTGFEPFGKEDVNPSWQAVKSARVDEKFVRKLLLPVVFAEAFEALKKEMESCPSDYVIMFGQAGGRTDISLERIAVNFDDATIPDNNGSTPFGKIDEQSPYDGLFSSLDIYGLVKILREKKIPASISNSAGNFVCNNLFYKCACYIKQNNLPVKSGFIHVPYSAEQAAVKAGVPFMPIDLITRAVEEIICFHTGR
ncbi:MAG TPA: pyroglutamyl-peptidase I [Petrotogaceae bacterium]|nr:pyroglutamyl-peptidase I [Petrotogaceae bacterium]HQO12369.1 pyroglutamyl-peptidase I [Petrotogaceae bacterium]HQP57922.1 pyroglutamyl-peptidase I [Petrotogaceae bacterium]